LIHGSPVISEPHGIFGPRCPSFGAAAFRLIHPLYRAWYGAWGAHDVRSRYARERLASLRDKLARGETAYLAGIGAAGHNSGVSLVEVSAARGPRLLWNDEEERFSGIKHDANFPELALAQFRERLRDLGLAPRDVHAWLASWDYASVVAYGWRAICEQMPTSWLLFTRDAMPKWRFSRNGRIVRRAARRLGAVLGLDRPQPLIAMPHHENHASFSYAGSPFNQSPEPVMVTVLDGFGDDGAISLFLVRDGRMERVYSNASFADSLGVFYSVISSTQGGWTTLSSEGRYMGAVAWGDQNRLTNRYYKRLREIFHLAPEGRIYVNRALANWQNSGEIRPYKRALERLIGAPIPPGEMWNPDRVLRVEEVRHPEATRDRVDLAAATQLVFEDAVFHIIEHFIRATGSSRLVMTGGTALNCLANMQLLERFDRQWYRRNLGTDARLHLWVPPTPGDAGVPIGAAYSFALRAGAKPREVLQHAFYCGRAATSAEILRAIAGASEIGYVRLGDVNAKVELDSIADLAALVVADDGVVGLYQGPAETGPRALGHRSILANPCNPRTLENINRLVKFREPIRPLAPMVTLEEAARLFELGEGAADDRYNAYNYMVLTVRARQTAYERVPAVVHRDGTARIQIVRPEHDPFTYAYLKAMGRRLGVEASVNTSLNVGSPIVQTPEQALGALRKAKALTGLLMLSAEGDAFMAWDTSDAAPKDGGQRLRRLMREWKALQAPVA